MPHLRIVNTFPLSEADLDAIRALPGVASVVSLDDVESEAAAEDLAAAEVLWGELPDGDLRRAPRLRWMARAGAGVEDLDLSALAAGGVTVTNASGLHASSMGEYILGAILFGSQQHAARMALQRDHRWDPERGWANPIRGRAIAILGYGSIGREVARLASSFGMRVLAAKARPDRRADEGFGPAGVGDPDGSIPERIVGLDALHDVLAEADVVVIALPLTDATRGILGRLTIAAMKHGAYLVNVGRGPMIDEMALIEALREGRLSGAYLDVFDEEPLPPGHPYWDTPNLYVSPHIAGVNSYERYWAMMGPLLIENTQRLLDGQPLMNEVDPTRSY